MQNTSTMGRIYDDEIFELEGAKKRRLVGG